VLRSLITDKQLPAQAECVAHAAAPSRWYARVLFVKCRVCVCPALGRLVPRPQRLLLSSCLSRHSPGNSMKPKSTAGSLVAGWRRTGRSTRCLDIRQLYFLLHSLRAGAVAAATPARCACARRRGCCATCGRACRTRARGPACVAGARAHAVTYSAAGEFPSLSSSRTSVLLAPRSPRRLPGLRRMALPGMELYILTPDRDPN
jgi:hypothetical protein